MERASGMGLRWTAVLLLMGEDKINAAEVESLVVSGLSPVRHVANS